MLEHALGEIFQVHLVHDADAGRHDLEGVERLHAPLEKLVALAVAREFQVQILFACESARAGEIHLHRVIHHEIHRHERLDDLRDSCPAAPRRERIAARSTSSGTPVKSCNTMRATTNGISSVRGSFGFQLASVADVGFGHLLAVAIAQHGFQHDADGDGQFGDRADAGLFQRGQRVELPSRPVPRSNCLQRVKQVVCVAHKILLAESAAQGVKTVKIAPARVKLGSSVAASRYGGFKKTYSLSGGLV